MREGSQRSGHTLQHEISPFQEIMQFVQKHGLGIAWYVLRFVDRFEHKRSTLRFDFGPPIGYEIWPRGQNIFHEHCVRSSTVLRNFFVIRRSPKHIY